MHSVKLSGVILALAGAAVQVSADGSIPYVNGVAANSSTSLTLTVGQIAQLVGDVVANAGLDKDALAYMPDDLTIADEYFDISLAQGAPQHFKSYNTTSADLYMKFIVDSQVPSTCPPAFNATQVAGWTKMTYGIPWRLPQDATNDTGIVAWQLSRPLYNNETIYHATWGTGFMATEAGNMCGYNIPTSVGNAYNGPLTACKDLYVLTNPARCINAVLRG